MPLTDHERQIIWHALNVAADMFDCDAKRCAAQPEFERLTAQFEQQAADTRALIDRFESR